MNWTCYKLQHLRMPLVVQYFMDALMHKDFPGVQLSRIWFILMASHYLLGGNYYY